MRKVIFIIPISLSLGCRYSYSQKSDQGSSNDTKDHHHRYEKKEQSNPGSANEYMHQTSVSELARQFESPERDKYQQPEKVLNFLGNITGRKIMDLGAGSGYFSVKLASRGAFVIAADVNDEFQEFIKERIRKNNLSNIETRKIPYDAPGLKDQEVDMVLIVDTYHHIENRTEYFTKVKRGTKQNGELVIIDFYKYKIPVGPPVDHKVGMDEVINELKNAGYNTFEVNVNLLPYQYIIKAK